MAIANLPQLKIVRAIFHDVPSKNKLTPATPVLCDVDTPLDNTQREHLRTRVSRVLGSSRAYPIVFAPVTDSPVPAHVRDFTTAPALEKFIEMSKKVALFLFDRQNGAISSGLLCVLEATIGAKCALVLMKLEREQGAQLKLVGATGKKTFDMSVLDNLVLTDGTRLFKTAFFLRDGKDDDDFTSIVCDDQNKPSASVDLAQFWIKFVGGQVVVEPRIATQRFYDAVLDFINVEVTDPVTKHDLYESLHSQLKTQSATFAPKSFIEQYVPPSWRKPFAAHLQARSVPITSFKKDLADIEGRLRRAQYRTTLGAVVTVPVENSSIVTVTSNQIVVADSLVTVDHK